MNSKTAIFVSVFAAVLMLLPGVASAYNYYDYSATYGITDSSSNTQFYEGTNNLYFNMGEST